MSSGQHRREQFRHYLPGAAVLVEAQPELSEAKELAVTVWVEPINAVFRMAVVGEKCTRISDKPFVHHEEGFTVCCRSDELPVHLLFFLERPSPRSPTSARIMAIVELDDHARAVFHKFGIVVH